MTQLQVIEATGLTCREMTAPKEIYSGRVAPELTAMAAQWKCQLGEIQEHVARFSVRNHDGTVRRYEESCHVFRLIAWGPTWGAAFRHWRSQQPTVTKAQPLEAAA